MGIEVDLEQWRANEAPNRYLHRQREVESMIPEPQPQDTPGYSALKDVLKSEASHT